MTTVQLHNPKIKHIVAVDDIRETSFYTHFKLNGNDFKTDYIYRLYKNDGYNTKIIFTGVCTAEREDKNTITLTLESRVNELSQFDGVEVKTDLAGWAENVEFGDGLNLLLSDTEVETSGDTESIDYYTTQNEGDKDIRTFKK